MKQHELTEEVQDYINLVVNTLVPNEHQNTINDILKGTVHFIRTKENKLKEYYNLDLYDNSNFIELCNASLVILEESAVPYYGVLQKRGMFVDVIEVHSGVLYFYSKGYVRNEFRTDEIDKSFLFNISTLYCKHLLISLALIICINVILPSYYILDMQYLLEYLEDDYVRDEDS